MLDRYYSKPAFFIFLAALLPASHTFAGSLVDLIPSLYGGDGLTLATDPDALGIPHDAHFTGDSQTQINRFNAEIAGEVEPAPVRSSTGGTTYEFDPEQGSYIERAGSLGPSISERPQTLGKGRYSFGVAYTRFEYNKFEGNSLSSLSATLSHPTNIIGTPDGAEEFERDQVIVGFDVDLRYQSLALSAIYGITDRLDVGIVVPIVDVDMKVNATARVAPHPETVPNVHLFDDTVGDSPFARGRESATGVGDILLNAKYYWLEGDTLDVSGAMQLKLETGDEDDFLGTGGTTFRPYVIGSLRLSDMVNLHMNFGYEFDFDDSDLNTINYVVGSDFGNQKLTGSVDVLGRHALDGDGIGDDLVDAALGLKWKAMGNLIVSANVVLPLNSDQGLRSDVISTIGIEYLH